MIDSHCHLADAKFHPDLDAVLTRAKEAGVDRYVCIADSLQEGEDCLSLAEKYDQIFCTIGVHPHLACEWSSEEGGRKIREIAAHSQCVAIGEIGLDYHYMNSPKDDQIRALRDQIAIAQELNLPIVVHNRESFADLLPIIDELQPKSMVLHCCTEPWNNAREIVERGYFLGFTGIATYPKSEDIRDVIRRCPVEQLMIETDAPYLAPEGKRGQRCEPVYCRDIAQLIAEIKDVSFEEIDRITTANTVQFYDL